MNKIVYRLVVIAGSIELFFGGLHFIFPMSFLPGGSLYQSVPGDFATLSQAFKNFIVLLNSAVGIFLICFGIVTLYFAKPFINGFQAARVFMISQVVLWIGRSILELIYPVKIPLLIFTDPSVIVLISVVSVTLLYLVSVSLQNSPRKVI